MFRFKVRNSTSLNNASYGFQMFFSVVWTLFSLVFVAIGLFADNKPANRNNWVTMPCQIERCEIKDDPSRHDPFSLDLLFRYSHHGTYHTGTKTAKEDDRYESYKDAVKQQTQLMALPEAVCQVNPENPDDAVLLIEASDSPILFRIIFAFVGTLFASVGISLFINAWKQRKAAKLGESGMGSLTHQSKLSKSKEPNPWILYAFCSLFAFVGFGILFVLIIPMWKDVVAARSWVNTPAEVIWSKVQSHSGSEGDSTYSVKIFYRYSLDGKDYKSDRVGFFSGSSSGSDSKQEKVNAYPPGKSIEVWVNPAAPAEAVIERNLGNWAWFSLFPFPFIAVGLIPLFVHLHKKKNPPHQAGGITGSAISSKVAGKAQRMASASTATGSLHLPAGKGRLTKVLGIGFAAAFWNGLISIFLFDVIRQWKAGNNPWGMTLFLIPFLLVGLGLVLAMLYHLAAFFNPRPRVQIDPGFIRLGHTFSARWEVRSGASRLRNLSIILRGEEVATYQRGTNSSTARSTFFEQNIAGTELPEMIAMGHGSITLPVDLPPTWTAKNNKIEWTIEIRGTISLWPDLCDKHTIEVHSAT